MQKNTFQPLAMILALFSLAMFLPGSVAELTSAASGVVHDSPQELPARVLTGPRKHNTRSQPVTPPTITEVPEKEVKPPVVIDLPGNQSTIDRILDRSGVDAKKRPLVAAVLGLLEPECLEQLRTFSVLYDHPQHRGLAGKGVIFISGTVPDQEFIGLMMHEGLGHYRDITCVIGTPASGTSEFHDGDAAVYNDDPSVAFYRISWLNEKTRKPDALKGDFVTGYSYEADNFEDLAESVAYYMTQETAFRERAVKNAVLAEKLAWLGKYMPKKTNVATGSEWDGAITWDATKLGFTWIGN